MKKGGVLVGSENLGTFAFWFQGLEDQALDVFGRHMSGE
jgi:hypothetical protein